MANPASPEIEESGGRAAAAAGPWDPIAMYDQGLARAVTNPASPEIEESGGTAAAAAAGLGVHIAMYDQANVVFQRCATLWSIENDRAVILLQDLVSIMERLGFRMMHPQRTVEEEFGNSLMAPSWPCSGTDWRAFRYVKGRHSRAITKRYCARVPYPIIEGSHPCVYLTFLENVGRWIGKEAVSRVFKIRIVPLTREVRYSTLMSKPVEGWDGLFPCSWRNEDGLIAYRLNTLDRMTREGPECVWSEEYRSDLEGTLEQRYNLLLCALSASREIIKYEKGVAEEMKSVRLVCLWDVRKKCYIVSHAQLCPILEEIGFSKEHRLVVESVDLVETDEHYPGWVRDDEDYPGWITGDEDYICYVFPGYTGPNLPWLPYPWMVGYHPLIYFSFLNKVAGRVGWEKLQNIIGIRGAPLALLDYAAGEKMHSCSKSTWWMDEADYIYHSSVLMNTLRVDIPDIEHDMLQYGVSLEDIQEYKHDAVEDMGTHLSAEDEVHQQYDAENNSFGGEEDDGFYASEDEGSGGEDDCFSE